MPRTPLKAARRQERALKERRSPSGGGFGAQAKRSEVNNGYAGLAKGTKKRIVAKIKA